MPANLFIGAGALLGAMGVVLGAFGAHGLAERLSDADLQTWNTAVQYQFVHTLALLAVGVLGHMRQSGSVNGALAVAGVAFLLGMLMFCGSLYVLALGGPRFLGPVTPVGGVAFIVAWLALVVAAVR